MIVLTDATLRAAGLTFDEAKALISTANTGELLVYVKQELSHEPDDDVLFSKASPFREIRDDGGGGLRHMPSTGAASSPASTSSPTSSPPFTERLGTKTPGDDPS